jgi:hypothetical protein
MMLRLLVNLIKLTTDVVLDKISNTKLVPVSDKDVALSAHKQLHKLQTLLKYF